MKELTHLFSMLHFCTSWKHQKSSEFSDVFRGYRNVTLGTNELICDEKLHLILKALNELNFVCFHNFDNNLKYYIFCPTFFYVCTSFCICCTHLYCTYVYCFNYFLGQQFVEHYKVTSAGTGTKYLIRWEWWDATFVQPLYIIVVEYVFLHNYFQVLAQKEIVKFLKFTIQ